MALLMKLGLVSAPEAAKLTDCAQVKRTCG